MAQTMIQGFAFSVSAALAFLPVHNPLHAFDLNGRQLLLCLSLGLIPTAIAYLFLFRAIETVGSAYTAIFSTFEPVTTVVMSFLVLNENIVFYQVGDDLDHRGDHPPQPKGVGGRKKEAGDGRLRMKECCPFHPARTRRDEAGSP